LQVNGGASIGGMAIGSGVLLGTSVQVNNFISNGSNIAIRTTGVNTAMTIFQATANVLIQNGGTHTDAGFRLDVNGTARVRGNFQVGVGSEILQLYTGNYRSFIDGSGTGIMNIRVLTTNVMTLTTNGVAMNLAGESFVNASSIFELISTTKGFLPPRMTTTQRNAIASPAAGLMVYDTTLNAMFYYNGTIWI
jgi:hypothetical protein